MSSSTSPRATPRRGMALAIALGAIVVVGALIVGVIFASNHDYRVGRNSLATQRAAHAAEVGLASLVSSWTPARTNATTVGQSVALADTTIDGVTVERRFSRVSPTTFWVTVTATQGGGSLDGRAQKRLNSIMRVEIPDFRIMGAVTSRGKTVVAGTTTINGTDTVPPGWDCPPGGAQGAGLVVNDSATNVTTSGARYVINGTPKIKDSTAMVSDTMTFTRFGGFSYDSLAALATKFRTGGGTIGTITPSTSPDGSCDIGDDNNWGAVTLPHACASYFPIVHLRGASNSYLLNGNGGGQGILLVDGNLSIAGTFKWTGLILVRGKFALSGAALNGGVKIVGAVAAMNRNAATDSITGVGTVTFSRCVISHITSRFATVQPLQRRGWADLSF